MDDSELTASSAFAEPRRRVLEFLNSAPETIVLSGHQFVLAERSKLDETQLGDSVAPDGGDLTGTADGDWQSSWIVIGWDEDLGDPLFVDLADEDLPVFTAEHGRGAWRPIKVSDNLATLI